ncbi:Uncharacterised protein [Candidatus Burarchaeum australiense]|nr:Uncharacterised protein [Candidatus Burarchaeum australiense]
MTKFVSGFLIGFFLASLLLFGYINLQLGPSQNEIYLLKQYSESAYATTHSASYANIQAMVSSLNELSTSIAQLPVVGGAIDVSRVPEYTSKITELLNSVKVMSESSRTFIETVVFLLNISLAMVVISVIMIAVGGYLYYMPEKGGRRAKG